MNCLFNLSVSIRGGYQFGCIIDFIINEFKNESIGFNGFGVDVGVILFNGLVIINFIKQSKFDVQVVKLDVVVVFNDIVF